MTKRAGSLPDTNSILRYLLMDHKELYEKACDLFEKVRTGDATIMILESVLVECVYVLMKFYKVPRPEVAKTFKNFLGYKGVINTDKRELVEALTLFEDSTLDIVDCILCAKAKKSGMSLFTFDKALARKFTK